MRAIIVLIALIGVALVYVFKEIRWITHCSRKQEKQIKALEDAYANLVTTVKDFSNSVTAWADAVAEWSKHEDNKINKNSWILQKQIAEMQKKLNREAEKKTEKE